MKLLTKQEHAVFYLKNNIHKEVIYGGAAGGGKTALGCLWLIEMCQNYPCSRWVMGRSKLKSLKETTLNTFFEVSSKLNVSNQFNYNAQSNIIYWKNGSEIILKDLFLYPSDPDFDNLGSLEITGAFVDECNQITYKAWQILKSRIRYKLKEFNLIPKILGTCNPSKNWVYKKFFLAKKDKSIKNYRAFVQALPTDNEHLPESYLENLLQLDKASRERLYFGNWEYDDDPNALIQRDSINDYFNPIHIKGTGIHYLTIDVARQGQDKTVFRIWNGWICIDRFSFDKNTIPDVVEKAKEFQLKYKIPSSRIVCDGDGVGGGVVDYLRCLDFVNNSKPINGDNYENLKTQCTYYVAKKIELRECGEICEDSNLIDHIIEEMEQVKSKDSDKDAKMKIVPKDEVKKIIGRSPDEWDSIMMRALIDLKPISKKVKVRR